MSTSKHGRNDYILGITPNILRCLIEYIECTIQQVMLSENNSGDKKVAIINSLNVASSVTDIHQCGTGIIRLASYPCNPIMSITPHCYDGIVLTIRYASSVIR